MTKTKWTPGEWRVGSISKIPGFSFEVFSGEPSMETGVATIWNSDPDCERREEAIANAHLIVAAPEMYSMLRTLRSVMRSMGYETIELQIDKLLAKARGET